MSETLTEPGRDRTHPAIRRLFLFFAIAYFAQGISQDKAGMLSQTLKYYYTQHEHMASTAIADFAAPLMLPWVIKPVYGLISDLLPLGRYRRKSYLVLTCLMAICGFVLILFAPTRYAIRGALFLTSLGIAFGDVLVDALMIENGQRTGYLRLFQGVQWQWVSIAGVAAALLGGQLSQHLGPELAVRVAALIAIVPLLALLVSALFFVQEEPTGNSRGEALASLKGLGQALSSKVLWKMAIVIFLLNFAPNAGTAGYVFFSEVLKIPQAKIGYLDAAGALSAILGAFLFNRLLAVRVSQRRLLTLSILIGAAGAVPMLAVRSFEMAFGAALIGGMTGMIAQLAMLSLAGEACPARAEGFTFAALMSLSNQATQWGDQIGSRIFDRAHQQLWPLVLANIATSLLALFLVPLVSAAPAATIDKDE